VGVFWFSESCSNEMDEGCLRCQAVFWREDRLGRGGFAFGGALRSLKYSCRSVSRGSSWSLRSAKYQWSHPLQGLPLDNFFPN